jgi:hypothetical protein
MTRFLAAAAILAALGFALAACDGGAKDAGPVPGGSGSSPSASGTGSGSGSTSSGTTSTSSSQAPLCSDKSAAVAVAAREGAAGTISTTWRVTNTGQTECRTYGYPGMDFHSASGWLDVQVHRGGYPNIDVAPAPVVLAPGGSLYFVSYWGDVDTQAGPCKQFDHVKVTLPDNYAPARLATTGCLDPKSVDVGPVSASRPS